MYVQTNLSLIYMPTRIYTVDWQEKENWLTGNWENTPSVTVLEPKNLTSEFPWLTYKVEIYLDHEHEDIYVWYKLPQGALKVVQQSLDTAASRVFEH